MRDLGTPQLKRVVSKMPHGQGKLYKCEVVSTSLWKNSPGKCRQKTHFASPPPSAISDPGGPAKHLAAEAAPRFPAPGAPPQPEPSSHVGSRAVERVVGVSAFRRCHPLRPLYGSALYAGLSRLLRRKLPKRKTLRAVIPQGAVPLSVCPSLPAPLPSAYTPRGLSADDNVHEAWDSALGA